MNGGHARMFLRSWLNWQTTQATPPLEGELPSCSKFVDRPRQRRPSVVQIVVYFVGSTTLPLKQASVLRIAALFARATARSYRMSTLVAFAFRGGSPNAHCLFARTRHDHRCFEELHTDHAAPPYLYSALERQISTRFSAVGPRACGWPPRHWCGRFWRDPRFFFTSLANPSPFC